MPPLFLPWLVVMWPEPKQSIKSNFSVGQRRNLSSDLEKYVFWDIFQEHKLAIRVS